MAEAHAQYLAARLCQDYKFLTTEAFSRSDHNHWAPMRMDRTRSIPGSIHSELNVIDLQNIERPYKERSIIDAVKKLNRDLLGEWKGIVRGWIEPEYRRHLNQEARRSLRECAAWYTMLKWLEQANVPNMQPRDIIEKYVRDQLVKYYHDWIIGKIDADIWNEDPDVV